MRLFHFKTESKPSESAEYWKSAAKQYLEDSNEYFNQLPYYEFIYKDRITGWVFGESFSKYPDLQIGDTVTFVTFPNNPTTFEFTVLSFDGIRNRMIGVYIEPKEKEVWNLMEKEYFKSNFHKMGKETQETPQPTTKPDFFGNGDE